MEHTCWPNWSPPCKWRCPLDRLLWPTAGRLRREPNATPPRNAPERRPAAGPDTPLSPGSNPPEPCVWRWCCTRDKKHNGVSLCSSTVPTGNDIFWHKLFHINNLLSRNSHCDSCIIQNRINVTLECVLAVRLERLWQRAPMLNWVFSDSYTYESND